MEGFFKGFEGWIHRVGLLFGVLYVVGWQIKVVEGRDGKESILLLFLSSHSYERHVLIGPAPHPFSDSISFCGIKDPFF